MPIYEYECEPCSMQFEAFASIEEMHEVVCPDCYTKAKKLVSLPRFKLEPVSGHFTTATDRWAKRKERANWDDLQSLGLRPSRKTYFGT